MSVGHVLLWLIPFFLLKAGAQTLSCGQTITGSQFMYGSNSWTFTIPITQTVEINTCGSSYDTILSINTSPSQTNDDGCSSLQSRLSLTNLPAGSYTVTLTPYSSTSGSYRITALCSQCAIPSAPNNAGAGNCTSPFRIGTSCVQSCNSGFYLSSGSLLRSCSNNLAVSSATGVCTACACSAQATCVGSQTSVSSTVCACNIGYTGDGFSCSDVDECATGTHGCTGINTSVLCQNTPGSYLCFCPSGFTGLGSASSPCLDINECALNTTLCKPSTCINTPGSYRCSPLLLNGTLTGTPTSTAGGQISFEYIQPDASVIIQQVYYGPRDAPTYYTCQSWNVSVVSAPSRNRLTCQLSPGTGVDMTFQLSMLDISQGSGIGSSVAFTLAFNFAPGNTFSFPPPTILPNTIRLTAVNNASDSVLAQNTLGDRISFNGTNFVSDPRRMQVSFGRSGFGFNCELVTAQTNSSVITCNTQPYANGTDLVFAVKTPDYSFVGTDKIIYPPVPELLGVQGCENVNASTIDCPTEGEVSITIAGTGFYPPVGVLISGKPCRSIAANLTYITCVIAEGAGFLQPVVVTSGQQFSNPLPFLSYGAPIITSIQGCEGNPSGDVLSLVNCTRTGSDRITIRGRNFGAQGAKVLIGSSECTNPDQSADPHHLITCELPSGFQLLLPVLIFQYQGEYNRGSPVSISYKPCEPGERPSGIECLPCRPGLYSPEGFSCQECLPGTFTAVNRSASCEPCPIGKFQENLGGWNCSDCALGSIADSVGSKLCRPCVSGRFAQETNSTVCAACELGTYQQNAGEDRCEPCESGSVADVTGLASCRKCAKGSYAVDATRCERCEQGKYQTEDGQTTCNECPPGSYSDDKGKQDCILCPVGFFTPLNGSKQCQQCGPGYYQDQANATSCLSCKPGFYSDGDQNSYCKSCSPGEYTIIENATVCQPCGVGFYQDRTEQIMCSGCPPGTSSSNRSSSCEKCSPNTIAPLPGISCFPCANSILANNADNTRCVCPVGTYEWNPTFTEIPRTQNLSLVKMYYEGLICIPCPLGALCRQPGLSVLTIGTLKGFWREVNTSTEFLRCLSRQECNGVEENVNLSTSSAQCADNRQGPLCALCAPGYYSTFGRSGCSICPSKGTTSAVVLFYMIIFLVALVILYTSVLVSAERRYGAAAAANGSSISQLSKAMLANKGVSVRGLPSKSPQQPLQLSYMEFKDKWYFRPEFREAYILRVDEDEEDAVKAVESKSVPEDTDAQSNASAPTKPEPAGPKSIFSCFWKNERYLGEGSPVFTEEYRVKSSFTFTLKILLGFFQIGSGIVSSSEIPFPTVFRDFMSYFFFISLDFIPWVNLKCVAKVEYYDRFLAVTLIPILALVFLFFIFLLPMWYLDRRDFQDDSTRRIQRSVYQRRFYRCVLFTLFLIYPGLSTRVLGFFNCQKVGDRSFLVSDFSVECETAQWNRYLPYAVWMTIIYPIGIPLVLFAVLYKYRRRLNDPVVGVALGFLYEAYRPSYWWFELADMLHKLLLTGLFVLYPLSVRLQLGMAFSCLFTVILLYTGPYLRQGDDSMHFWVQVAIFLVLLCGSVFYELGFVEPKIDLLMSSLLIIMIISLVLYFIILVLRYLRNKYRDYQRNQMLKLDSRMQAEDAKELELTETGTSASPGPVTRSGEQLEQPPSNHSNPSRGAEPSAPPSTSVIHGGHDI